VAFGIFTQKSRYNFFRCKKSRKLTLTFTCTTGALKRPPKIHNEVSKKAFKNA